MYPVFGRRPVRRDLRRRWTLAYLLPSTMWEEKPTRKARRRRNFVQLTLERLEDLTLLSSSISGSVWNDLNGDGFRQGGEPGLAAETVFLDLNHSGTRDGTVITVPGTSRDVNQPTPGPLGGFGALGPTLEVSELPRRLLDLNVALDLVNNGAAPVPVCVVSPEGLQVPNLPTLFTIQPGEHFRGTFDEQSANPVTLAVRPLAPGSYRPQQFFVDPRAHIYEGDPNGTWGLVFFGDVSGLTLNSWALTFTLPEPTAQTDASGNYTFADLEPDSYAAGVALAPAAEQTQPAGANAVQTVQLAADQDVRGIDFGVQPAADLTATAFQLAAPAHSWGQDVTVQYTLTNQGAGDAAAFGVELRLSSNGILDGSSLLLDTIQVDGLASRANHAGFLTIQLPAAPPAGFAALADTYLGLIIDPANAISESDELNNSNQGAGIDSAALAARANQALAEDAGVQQMPSVAVNPRDAQHVVVAYMDYALIDTGYAGLGVAASHDGGATWERSSITLPPEVSAGAASPKVVFDDQGHVFVSFLAATFLGPDKPALTTPASPEREFGFRSNNGIFVARSDDGGRSWNAPTAVVAHQYTGSDVLFEVLPDSAADTFALLPDGRPNPNYGNLYVTWVRLYPAGQFPGQPQGTGGSDVMIAVSRDGGQTWTTQMQTRAGAILESAIKDPDFGTNATSPPGRGFNFFPHVSVGPEGDVYVAMFGAGDFSVFHSTDGAASFRAPDRANGLGAPFQAVLPLPTLFNAGFRTSSVRAIVADPARPGHVYAAEANNVFNPVLGGIVDAAEIIFARSDDYGQTWQRIFTVGSNPGNLLELAPDQRDIYLSVLNDDNDGRYLAFADGPQLDSEVITGQALPALTIDAAGNLVLTWYDTRRDPADHSLDVFGTVSTDGGQTFTANYRVTDSSFDPDVGAFTDAQGNENFYLGDLIGVAAANSVSYAVWTDTRSGSQDIYFARQPLIPAPQAGGDRYEPNNRSPAATDLGQVSAERAINKLTITPGDEDWYRLETTATGQLVVSATVSSGATAPQLTLTDAEGNVLPAIVTDLHDQAGGIAGRQLVFPSTAEETYLVRVQGATTTSVPYTLEVGSLTADLGTRVAGSTTGSLAAGDQAVYRLAAAVTGSLEIALQPAGDVQGNLHFEVRGADGKSVLASGPAGGAAAGAAALVSVSVTQGQVLLLRIAGVDAAAQGGFTLRFRNLDQFQTPQSRTLFVPAGGDPAALSAADLTGDGRPDVVVTSTDFSDPISVLNGNGDGTFQAPRRFDVGPGLSGTLTAGFREPVLADLDGDDILDAVIPNFRSADVSVLLGRGDGTFQPQRRFDALPSPDSLVAGDFNGDGHVDLIALQNFPQLGGVSRFAVLLGRGDGTFAPPARYATIFTQGAFPVRVGDFNADGTDDLIFFSKNEPRAHLFPGNGDGTFADAGAFAIGENTFDAQVLDLDGDSNLDLITTSTNSGNVYLLRGNGDGTFQAAQAFVAMPPRPGDNVGVSGLTLVDFGSPPDPDAATKGLGPGDGHLDIVVTAVSRSGVGSAQVILLPGLVDADGRFAGFGSAQRLAFVNKAGKITAADFDQDGAPDLATTDVGGVRIVYGRPLTLPRNSTAETARDLGSVAHLITPLQAIVPGHDFAYYTLTVPTEAAAGSGDQVLDFSARFEHTEGRGLQLEVRDAQGTLLGAGERFRVRAAQGEVLSIRVFGQFGAGGTFGSGAYTLNVTVLPQVVSVQAQSALPNGLAASLVLTLQGDRLDRASAEDPANYTVTWFGPDGAAGTGDDQVIPAAVSSGSQPIVYNPGANVDVSSGRTYPTAVRQTITLLFAAALPAGSYGIRLSPNIQAASFSADEIAGLAGDESFAGHPIVSVTEDVITNGSRLVAPELVTTAGAPGAASIGDGTPFLTQLQNDLGALLDALLLEKGDDAGITGALNDQILARFAPAFLAATASSASSPLSIVIFWLDPVSIDLQAPQGDRVVYNQSTNQVANTSGQSYVEVGGNVEVVVVANIAGTFKLDVADVPDAARGGAVVLDGNGAQTHSFTDGLRSGTSSFSVDVASAAGPGTPGIGPGTPPTSESPAFPPPVDSGGTTAPGGTTTPPGGTPIATPVQGTPVTSPGNPALGNDSSGGTSVLVNAAPGGTGTTSVAQTTSLGQAGVQTLVATLLIGVQGDALGQAAVQPGDAGDAGGAAAAGTQDAAAANAANASQGTGTDEASSPEAVYRQIQRAVDQVLRFWQDATDLTGTMRDFCAGATIAVLKQAAAQVAGFLKMLGWTEPTQVNLAPQEVRDSLIQSGASVLDALGQQLRLRPVRRVAPAKPAPTAESEAAGDPLEDGLGLLWDAEFIPSPCGQDHVREVDVLWAALAIVAGAYHGGLREAVASEQTSPRKKDDTLTEQA